jgi:hypothetical protein
VRESTLPHELLVVGLQDFVSCDGQIYFSCERCEREARIHYTWIADPAQRKGIKCAGCGHHVDTVVRHVHREAYRCRDCSTLFDGETAGFERVQCAKCGSYAIEVLDRTLVPDFPGSFDELTPHKRYPWGKVLKDDLEYLRAELRGAGLLMDGPAHLLIAARFCARLRYANEYDPETVGIALENEEANLYLGHCKQTGEIVTGLRALALFEELATRSDDILMGHHVVSIAAHALLLRFTEAELASAGFPTVRADALAHARAAVELLEHRERDEETLIDLAKCEALLCQLLVVGDPTLDDQREALRIANHVIEGGHLPVPSAIKVVRANLLVKLPESRPEELDEAAEIFQTAAELAVLQDQREEAWHLFFNLGLLQCQRAKIDEAIIAVQRAASIVRSILGTGSGSEMIADYAARFAIVFELLAMLLARAGRGHDALEAFETMRGLTLVLDNDKDTRTQFAVGSILRLARASAGLEDEATPEESSLPSPDIDALLGTLIPTLQAGTAFLYYGWVEESVTALLISVDRRGVVSVDPLQWNGPRLKVDQATLARRIREGDDDVLALAPRLFNAMVYGAPSPLRNKRLTLSARDGYRYLFQPLEERLLTLGVKRVGICAAGPLTGVSFESFSTRERADWCIADDFDVFYVPSLATAKTMASYDGAGGSTLLIIGYSGGDLPEVDNEIEAIRSVWKGDCRVVRGADLNKRSALAALAGPCDFIHFAGHAAYDPGNHDNSAFYFASCPDDAPGDAWRLTAADLREVALNRHPTVTISACASGIASHHAARALGGLLGSLLRAGARAVITSRWAVADSAAHRTMSGLYRGIAEGDNGFGAFVRVQRASRSTQPIEEWAAFSYFGMP